MIEEFNEKCTGCSACYSACPFLAISMKEDEEGFRVPFIEKEKCKKCDICSKVCPIDLSLKRRKTRYYAVQHREQSVRKKSQSGGLFTALAEAVLSRGGVCYGAAFNATFDVIQTRIDSINSLELLQGSKYTQSNVLDSFKEVEKDLRNSIEVLYSGTSCTIIGLYNYLSQKGVPVKRLITCDLICHGVPSPVLWKDNIEHQKNLHGELKTVIFRDKKFGWHSHMETYFFFDGTSSNENFYTDLFYSHAALRKCCYHCNYIDVEKKPADITMADFWGIRDSDLEIKDDNTGISLASVHSQKGIDLIKSSNIIFLETNAIVALLNNLKEPSKPPKWREKFWKDYRSKGYLYILKKYSIYGGIKFKVKRKFLKLVRIW